METIPQEDSIILYFTTVKSTAPYNKCIQNRGNIENLRSIPPSIVRISPKIFLYSWICFYPLSNFRPEESAGENLGQ